LGSEKFNELRLVPSLLVEGQLQNDSLRTRRRILEFFFTVPPLTWWSMTAFVSAIHQADPDFQRPDGDYDSWFIRRAGHEEEGEVLRGSAHWDEVEGELIRFTIAGPMHWLGLVDLCCFSDKDGSSVAAFRTSNWSPALMKAEPLIGLPVEDKTITVISDGRLQVPRLAARSARYHISRFCAWQGETEEYYRYSLTPASLTRARMQGLKVQQLTSLLRRYAQSVPPSLIKALERWEQQGPEARLDRLIVLRLATPELMQAVRSSKAARFLAEPLGPTAVIVRPGARDKVLSILGEMGYLAESFIDE
jgi:hypothetical protein